MSSKDWKIRVIFKYVFAFYFIFVRWPIVILLRIIAPFNSSIGKRVSFERDYFKSNFVSNKPYYVCFHISSQGELEQIYPLIEFALEEPKNNIEICFTSESVLSNLRILKSKDPSRISIFTLNLLSLSPFHFISLQKRIKSSRIILCRYDFFPELLFLKFSRTLGLVNSRVKNKGRIYRYILRWFDFIVAATKFDEEVLRIDGANLIGVGDFRGSRVASRQLKAIKSPKYKSFKIICENWKGRVLGVGSSWKSDLDNIFNIGDFSKGNLYFFFPHKVDLDSINGHLNFIKSKVAVIDNMETFDFNRSILDGCTTFIVKEMGVLCDLYPYFDVVYVGGGFEKSIHSVLEPFVSGALVTCGPKVHRSSEYEYIKGFMPDRIKVINSPDDFNSILENVKIEVYRGSRRGEFIKSFSMKMNPLIKKVFL